MMRSYLTFLFLFFIAFSNAQDFYICNYNDISGISSIKYVDENLNVINIQDLNVNTGILFDIALDSDEKMYGVTSINTVIEIDLSNGFYTEIYQLPINDGGNGGYNSLVYDNLTNDLVILNLNTHSIYRLNLDSLTITSVNYIGTSTPGDLTFYKGNLIFQDTYTSDIFAVKDNDLITITCGFENNFYGFSNYVNSCDNNIIYAFEVLGNIFQFDIVSNSYEYVGNIINQTDYIYGSTTITEYLASSCAFETLEEIDCSLSVTEEDLSKINLYPNPTTGILNVTSPVFSEALFYSIYSIEGKILKNSNLVSNINIENLSNGIYFILIHDASYKTSISKKIIKL